MPTYYDKPNQRLVMTKQAASANFWDQLWTEPDIRKKVEQDSLNTFYTGLTQRFLPPNPVTRVLDAGCGQGAVVLSHHRLGYQSYGIDYAQQTIAAATQAFPELDLRFGDVADLPYEKNFFNAYWSLGVIEHFYQGYQPIIQEAWRVIRPGGYLFITFPNFNPQRRLKANIGQYRSFSPTNSAPPDFYQFALNKQSVTRDLTNLGFKLLYGRAVDGLKGLREEVQPMQPFLTALTHSQSRPSQLLGTAITELAAPFSGHVLLQVYQKP